MMPPHTSLAETKDGNFERRPPNRAKLLQARIHLDGVIQVCKAPRTYRPLPMGRSRFCLSDSFRYVQLMHRRKQQCHAQRTALPPLKTPSTHQRQKLVHPAPSPYQLPARSKTDVSVETPVLPEHHAPALRGSRLASWHQHLPMIFRTAQ